MARRTEEYRREVRQGGTTPQAAFGVLLNAFNVAYALAMNVSRDSLRRSRLHQIHLYICFRQVGAQS